MAKFKFCTSGGACITCSGLYDTIQEAAKTIEEAQRNGDKSFLCCNDGTGVLQCMRVSDISTITEVPIEGPDKDEKECRECSNINIYMKR
jgi:hypothetical protein